MSFSFVDSHGVFARRTALVGVCLAGCLTLPAANAASEPRRTGVIETIASAQQAVVVQIEAGHSADPALGLVFADANRNGLLDGNELGLVHVTVTVTPDPGVEPQAADAEMVGPLTVTPSNFVGRYETPPLPVGHYQLCATPPGASTASSASCRSLEMVAAPLREDASGTYDKPATATDHDYSTVRVMIPQLANLPVPPPDVGATPPVAGSPSPLASTGSDAGRLALVGVALLLMGGALVASRRRRRS